MRNSIRQRPLFKKVCLHTLSTLQDQQLQTCASQQLPSNDKIISMQSSSFKNNISHNDQSQIQPLKQIKLMENQSTNLSKQCKMEENYAFKVTNKANINSHNYIDKQNKEATTSFKQQHYPCVLNRKNIHRQSNNTIGNKQSKLSQFSNRSTTTVINLYSRPTVTHKNSLPYANYPLSCNTVTDRSSKLNLKQLNNKLSTLKLRLHDQDQQTQKCFEDLLQLQGAYQNKKIAMKNQHQQELQVFKNRVKQQEQRNKILRNKCKKTIEQYVMTVNQNSYYPQPHMLSRIKDAIVIQLYRRYPQGLPEECYDVESERHTYQHQNTQKLVTKQKERDSIEIKSNNRVQLTCKQMAQKYSNGNTLQKNDGQSILLDDSIFN